MVRNRNVEPLGRSCAQTARVFRRKVLFTYASNASPFTYQPPPNRFIQKKRDCVIG